MIDDIDTLTTKGLEAGFDFLYGVLWRAKRRSKILYTTRNAPTQSLANSIEVPGLEDGDYQEFVEVCTRQFNVQAPPAPFVTDQLSVISERRPLIIENIIALRRTAGSYDRAIHLFEEGGGEDVRNYVFQREWNALPAGNHGRYVLAILALHGGPLTFSDIVALTRYEDVRVKDALADIREMFLQLNEVGSETTFQLGALTKAFVLEQSRRLDLFSTIKERVEKYKANFYPENPILSRFKDRVENLVERGRRFGDGEAMSEALKLVSDAKLSPKISEDPRFISLQAHVYCNQSPPNLNETRRLFGHVFSMKFEPDIEHLKTWFLMERDSGYGLDQCIRIADFIYEGKRYTEEEKIEFLSRKGTCLYNRGKNEIHFSAEQALRDLIDSLVCHLICYSRNIVSASAKAETSERYATNTAYYLFGALMMQGRHDSFFDLMLELSSNASLKLDPIEEGVARATDLLQRERLAKQDQQKVKGRMEYLRKEVERKSQWFDPSTRKRVTEKLATVAQFVGKPN